MSWTRIPAVEPDDEHWQTLVNGYLLEVVHRGATWWVSCSAFGWGENELFAECAETAKREALGLVRLECLQTAEAARELL